MTEDVAIKWVEALRSGKYEQGFGALRMQNEDGSYCHCAAGVLADVIDPTGWTGTGTEWLPHEQDGFDNRVDEVSQYPQVYWHGSAFGLGKQIEDYGIDYTSVNTAMRMNDDQLSDFNTIADYLEEALSNTEIAG